MSKAPGRKEVLEFLARRADRPLRARDLARELGVSEGEYRSFRRLLRTMERDGEIFRQRKGRYALPEKFEMVVGRLDTTRSGDGFVVSETPGEEDVYVPQRFLATAVEGDRVVARIDRRRRGRNPEGRVVRVLERAWTQLVGPFHRKRGFGVVVPQEPPLAVQVLVPPESDEGAEEGDLVLVEVEDWGGAGPSPVGRVRKVLGRPGDPGMDVLAILLGHQLPLEFPPGVRAAAERVGRRGVRPEDVAGREDFRDRRVVTIDPADARDHDDALHVRALEDGGLEVGVHIADVSWYVKRGSELDREAVERGTSVYLVDRVVPMLPEELSAGLCSLVPDEDRLTLSVVFRATRDGEVSDARIVRGVIRSRHRLSYEQAQSLLDGQVPSPAPGDEAAAAALRDDLRLLDALARAVRGRRARAGAVDFAVPEARVLLDERGEPVEIHPRARLEAHRLIEDLMILANETVARIGEREELPLVYRIHEKPDPERIEALRGIVRVLGRDLPQDDVRPKDIARLLEAFEDRPQRALVSTVALRSMKQARYSVHNVGHFGLASEAYVHFTSPIRRYPDLAVHREIVRWLEGRARPGEDPERLEPVARHCSERERRAEKAERDSVDAKKVRYMLQHLGDRFTGTISGVTGFGLFVLLDELLVDGLVRVSSMVDDYYVLDEEAFALIGRRTRRRLRLGDRVEVRVARVDPEAREVDLELLEGPLDVA